MALKVSRRGQIPPFIVMDVMRAANDRAASGADVLHLEVGQPSTGAPAKIIASPANPTGTMLTREEIAALAGKCAERGIRLVSDEIYHGLTYGGIAGSTAVAASDDAIVVNSFSKYFSMTGWRLGWMVVPPA